MSESSRADVRRANHAALLVFFVTFGVAVFVFLLFSRAEEAEYRQRWAETATVHAARVQQLVDRSLSATFAMAAAVRLNSTDEQRLMTLASELLPLYPGVQSLQIARDGVVSHVYPEAANVGILGHDLLNDPLSRDEALLTIRSRDLHVAVPSQLKQGGTGFIGRYPVFLPDSAGKDRFWGFVSALVTLDSVWSTGEFDRLDQNKFAYRLWRRHPVTQEEQVILRSTADIAPDANVAVIGIPQTDQWYFSVAPTNAPAVPMMALGLVLCVVLAAVAAGMLRYIMMQPVVLAQLVRRKTRELGRANAQLHMEIRARKVVEHRLRTQVTHDQLTGLGNRLLLEEVLGQLLARARDKQSHVAFLMLDLDDFKSINDNLGYSVGDKVLLQVAKRLQRRVQPHDRVFRLGGDEFAIVLPDLMSPDEVGAIANTMLADIARPLQVEDKVLFLTASLGVAMAPQDATDSETLFGLADMAMYRAKTMGRNQVYFYDERLRQEVAERLSLGQDMRNGLPQGEFFLVYQPQVNAAGMVVGVEALLRWEHPQLGLVAPYRFIAIAERTGFIETLGSWVLAQACEQLASWITPDTQAMTMAVNVSERQFRCPDFVPLVLDTLARTGASPSRLKLELTESALAQDFELIASGMRTLRDAGVQFSLDDFGTGYSSLNYLKRLPLDQVKIDRAFVTEITSDPNDAAIARTVIGLGQTFGLSVIAEGVETEAQRDFLLSSGCRLFQGYLYSRPLTAPQLIDFLQHQRAVAAG